MSHDHPLESLLSEVGADARFLGPPQVDVLAGLVVDETLREELVSAVLESCDATGEDGARFRPDELPMRVGGWRLDVSRSTVRGGLMTAIVAGALVQQGLTEMVIGVVAAVIPSILDVERVELRPGDRRLLVQLRLDPDVRSGALNEDELYDRLPAGTREVVNSFEFADFVQRLRDAGYASGGSTTELRDPDAPPIRFSWR